MIVNIIMPLDGGAMSRDEPVRVFFGCLQDNNTYMYVLLYIYICFSPRNQGTDAQW